MTRRARTALLASIGLLATSLGPARADIVSAFDTNGEGWSVGVFPAAV